MGGIHRYASWSACALCVALLIASNARTQEPASPCASGVRPDDSAYKYTRHGQFCEGTIRRLVAADEIAFRSFTFEGLEFSENDKTPLSIKWHGPELDGTVRVEAHDVGAPKPFRMDGLLQGTKGETLWPLDTVLGVKMTSHQLGVLAYWEGNFYGSSQRIYVPAEVNQKVQLSGKRYVLVAVLGRPVSNVDVSIDFVPGDKTQASRNFAKQTVPVQSKVARIEFDRPAQPGLYQVFLTGKILGTKDKKVKASMYFYERGPSVVQAATQ